MMAFMHLYLKYTQPLFMQALMGLKGVFDAKPVAIHVFGKLAEGDLKRPFKAGGGFFGGMFYYLWNKIIPDEDAAGGDPATDRAAIEEAEKKVGSKKDD